LTPGQTFYEGPNDVHVIGRNASQTKPAKFVVFLVKNKDGYLCPSPEKVRGAMPTAHQSNRSVVGLCYSMR
jgi:hypothetical protein